MPASGATVIRARQPWAQRGRISLWRYTENTRNYPGWHLNADAAGCESLIALFQELATGSSPVRSVVVTPPAAAQVRVPNNRSAAWLAPDRIKVGWSPNASEWLLPPSTEPARLTFGSDWLEPLRSGVMGIPRGQGDYAIGSRANGSLVLWFWW